MNKQQIIEYLDSEIKRLTEARSLIMGSQSLGGGIQAAFVSKKRGRGRPTKPAGAPKETHKMSGSGSKRLALTQLKRHYAENEKRLADATDSKLRAKLEARMNDQRQKIEEYEKALGATVGA